MPKKPARSWKSRTANCDTHQCMHPLMHDVSWLRSPLQSRDVCMQPLWKNVLYSEKSKEAPRCRSSSIGWLFLRSMPPTLLPKRQPKETREDATLRVWWWRSFIGPSAQLNSSLFTAATAATAATRETQREVCVRRVPQNIFLLENAEETLRVDASPIGRLCLLTVWPTLLLKRSPQATSHQKTRRRAVRNTSCSHLPHLPEELPLPRPFDTTPQDPSTHFTRSIPLPPNRRSRVCALMHEPVRRVAGQSPRGVLAVP